MLDAPFPDELQQLIADEMSAGSYANPQDVVTAGVQLLRQQREELERLKAEVQIGIDQMERGEYNEYSREELRELFERLKERARLAGEQSEQTTS